MEYDAACAAWIFNPHASANIIANNKAARSYTVNAQTVQRAHHQLFGFDIARERTMAASISLLDLGISRVNVTGPRAPMRMSSSMRTPIF